MLYPITAEVLGSQESVTVGCVEVDVPSPVSDWARVFSEASLANEMLPEEIPAAGGVNVTV
jgi:hypothetical protein